MKKTRFIKALALGISACMLLQPIMVLAEEITDEEKEITVGAETSAPSYEEVKGEIESAVSEEISNADQKVESAEALEGYDYQEAAEAINDADNYLSNAAQDVQNAEDKLGDEKTDDVNLGVSIDLIDKNTENANNALGETEKAVDAATEAEKGIDTDTSTVKEAETAVEEIKEDIRKAEEGIGKAEDALDNAQSELNKAREEYSALESDKNASEEALAKAKEKITIASAALEEAKAIVESNKQTADSSFTDAQKLEAFKQISDLKDEIAAMTPEDKEYASKLEELSKLIVEFYVIEKVDEGTKVEFGESSEEYTTGYTTDENGEIVPVKETITYKTVTYIVDGETITKKIEFGLNDGGEVSITEKKIKADKEEGVFIPETETVLTDESGNPYSETENSIVIYIDSEDESKGFYAVDTATTEPEYENILPEENSVEETTEISESGTGLKHEKTYKKINPTDGDAKTSYEIVDGKIAEVTSREYDVEYTAYDEYEATGSGFEMVDDVFDAMDALEEELKAMYGEDNVEFIYERYTPNSFSIIYSVITEMNEKMTLRESRNIYAANEYIDRSPAPVYVDEDGNTYNESNYNLNIALDNNAKKGFYATNTNDRSLLLGKEIDEPISNAKFERNEEGRQKATYTSFLASGAEVTTVYTRETVSFIDEGFTTEKEVRLPASKEDLYEILNEYQGQDDVEITLKGTGDSSFDTGITYGRGWYVLADESFDQITEKTGGCIVEISRRVPNSHEETGIVERVITEYYVTTTVYVDSSASGICSSRDEAEETAQRVLTELGKKYIIDPNEPVIVEKQQGDETVWEYVIDYRIRTLDKTETQYFETAKSGYKDVLYKNSLAESKEYYKVSVDSETLTATDDEGFNDAVEEKRNAYLMASDAKEKAAAAATAYEAAMKAVSQAKASVEALEKANVPQTILDAAKAKLNQASKKLEDAQIRKADADAALLLATASLEYAQEKLETIKEKNSSPSPAPASNPTSVNEGTAYRAENAASAISGQASTEDVISSNGYVPATAQEVTADDAAVLGARKTEDKQTNVKKADANITEADTEAVVESDANADDKVKLTDSSEESDNNAVIISNTPVEIPDIQPALAATVPIDNNTGMIRVIVVAMLFLGSLVAAAVGASTV
ncbi:MAG: hypothetical protein K6F75_12805, partial [Butyrivibrio sp.]|nr:hypothetical protein [Butyrivibrio sp.]